MRVLVRQKLDGFKRTRHGQGRGSSTQRKVLQARLTRKGIRYNREREVTTHTDVMVSRELHAVKLVTAVNGLKACINRDTNAVLNMRTIVRHYLQYGERPYAFRRGVDVGNNGDDGDD